jgi:hypothetical protein
MIGTFIRSIFKFVLRVPVLGSLLKLSDTVVLGSMYGSYSIQNYEDALQYALHGLTRKRNKITEHTRWVWWEFMKYGIESAYKIYSCLDYEKLRDLVLVGPKPDEKREIAKALVKLSALGYSCKDKEGTLKLVELAGATDKTWGEPDYLMGWFSLPSEESVSYFKQAIEKDSSYKSRILNDKGCNKYPDLIAQLK